MKHIKKILKTEGIIKAHPNDTLSSVLSKLTSSHDAAFIFDDKNVFQGVINPYYTLIKSSSYDGSTKVEHALFHPPHVKEEDTIGRIVQLMNESKIHYLPIFDEKDKFLGIISARRILSYFKDLSIFKVGVEKIIIKRWQGLITVHENDTITQAINLFKSKKISKLIVINHDKKLKGVLSYYDLIKLMISPKYSSHHGERANEKISFYNYRVKNFAKSYVLTLSKERHLIEVINLIVNKKIGSVIIVDPDRRPLGIITTRDILRFFIDNEKFAFIKSLNPFKKMFKK